MVEGVWAFDYLSRHEGEAHSFFLAWEKEKGTRVD